MMEALAIYGGNHFALHKYQINMYSLNLHVVLCQLYLTKAEEKALQCLVLP